MAMSEMSQPSARQGREQRRRNRQQSRESMAMVQGNAGIKTVNNGPICYAPDGCPLLGPVESHPGLWLASGFPVGTGTGGGSGSFLADWMVEGEAPYDLPIVHPSRFSNDMSRDDCLAQITATYRAGYALSGDH
tara:strand:- start:30 stop:431 length:402 start_codon:yes stop_codon:yes gene_type:complete